jgi:superfamily I DNA/RNA helicase
MISEKQQVVYDTWTTTDSNMAIQAVAGSGKTTTLMGILERSEYRTLFLAFNKSIQEEISNRIEQSCYQHAMAMTLHSLGLMAVRKHYKKIHIEKGKNYQILKAVQGYNPSVFKGLSWEDKSKISITLMEMNNVSRIYMTNVIEEITSYMTEMDKFFFLHPQLEVLWESWLYSRQYFEDKGIIDFSDMIYLVVKLKLPIPLQPYYLMVDEAQDLSFVQHKFVDQFIEQGDIFKWVVVGDRRQSIYGFSGSHSTSFDLFEQKENVVSLPLDVCYRCPQLIVEQANLVYDVIIGHKEEPGIVEIITDFEDVKEGSMIICRNSAPLIDAYFQLLSIGRKVFIKGEDILNHLESFLKPYQYKTVKYALAKTSEEFLTLKKATDLSDRDKFKMYKLGENLKNLTLLVKNICTPNDKVDEVLGKIKSMFNSISDSNSIMLCTIHKSKGLEADIVYILDEFLIPSKFAKSSSQREQEQNLKYVARTRAKKEMYYLNIGKKSKEEE